MFDWLTNSESDHDGDRDQDQDRDRDRDRIFNTETRRALRRGAHQLGMGVVGIGVSLGMAVLAVFIMLGASHGTIPVTLAIGLTLVVTLAGPLVASYVTLRASGLSHPETVETARRAVKAAVRETPTLTDRPGARNRPGTQSGEPTPPRAGSGRIPPENTLPSSTDPTTTTDKPTYTIGDTNDN